MSLTLALFMGTTALIAFLIHNFNRKKLSYWPKLGVTYVDSGSFIGRIISGKLGFHIVDKPIYKQIKDNKERFGGAMELWNPVLFLTDLELMKNIYIKDFDAFSNRRGFNLEKNDPHLHFSIFNQKGQAWRTLRQIISPTFTNGKIRRMFSVFDTSGKRMCGALKEQLDETGSSTVEMREYLKKVTLDVITSSAFGVKSDIFETKDSMFFKMGLKMQETFAGLNMLKFLYTGMLPKLSSLFRMKMIPQEADDFFTTVVKKVLAHRRKTGEKREDFIQIMLEAQEASKLKENETDETIPIPLNDDGEEDDPNIKITDDLIISNSLFFIFGGFDTIEAVLDFVVYELAIHPDIQEKLVQKLEEARDDNGEFTYDGLYNLEYLEMIINETLRKYPPATRNERRAAISYKIPDSDVVIPKNQIVSLPVYQVHHDPDIWPEPEKFIPERFEKEQVAKRHIAAWQPFGLGPMNCIGNRFAMMEAKAAIAHLFLNFKLEPSEKTEIPIKLNSSGALRPLNDVIVKVSTRR